MATRICSLAKCYEAFEKTIGPKELEKIEPYDIRLLRNAMMQTYSEMSLKSMMYNFGLFLKFAVGTDACAEAGLRWNGLDPERVWITSGDWKVLFDASSPLEKLVLALGGTMGLRRTEMVSIKLSDIMGNVLRVEGKGTGSGKIVDMEMSAPVRQCLSVYLEWRDDIVSKCGDRSEGYLLLNPVRPDLGKPLTPRLVQSIVEDLRKRTGVNWTAHSLRRLFCMTMVDAGIDLDTTRRMMRHSSVETTITAYIKADPRKMHGAVSAVDTAFSTFT